MRAQRFAVDRRTRPGDEEIRFRRERFQLPTTLLRREIEHGAPAIAGIDLPHDGVAHRRACRRLDTQHVRAEIREQLTTKRATLVREIEYAIVLEQRAHAEYSAEMRSTSVATSGTSFTCDTV